MFISVILVMNLVTLIIIWLFIRDALNNFLHIESYVMAVLLFIILIVADISMVITKLFL